jgi:hypothetical protein
MSAAAFLDANVDGRKARESRQLAVRRFSAWLTDEQEILLGIKAPKLDPQVVEPLTEDEIKSMLKA